MSTRSTSKLLRNVLIGTIVAIVLMVLVIAMLLHRPSWFDSGMLSTSDAKQRGAELETAIVRELTRVRPGKEIAQGDDGASPKVINQATDPSLPNAKPTPGTSYVSEIWAVSIMETDINAWLSGRLPAWLDSREVQMPEAISNLRVKLEDNAAYIAAEYAGPPSVILTQPITFEITPEGDLSIKFSSISSGLLPLPGLNLTTLLPKDLLSSLLGEARNAAADPSGNDIHIPDATIGLEDGRTVRIIDLEVKSGRIEVACQTEK